MSIAMPAVDESPATAAGPDQPKPQQPQQQVWTPSGRLRVENLGETDRLFAVAMHLSPLSVFIVGPFAFIAPLILWLVRKDTSAFNDDHGRETLNFSITYMLFGFLLFWTFIVPAVLLVVGVVSLTRGAIAAGRGEYFRYPMTIRF